MKIVTIEDPDFQSYLLGEFFWELAQHPPLPLDFVGVQKTDIQILSYTKPDKLRICLANIVYDVQLSWRGDQPALIQRLE